MPKNTRILNLSATTLSRHFASLQPHFKETKKDTVSQTPPPSEEQNNHQLLSQMLKPKDKALRINELSEESIYPADTMKITFCSFPRLEFSIFQIVLILVSFSSRNICFDLLNKNFKKRKKQTNKKHLSLNIPALRKSLVFSAKKSWSTNMEVTLENEPSWL